MVRISLRRTGLAVGLLVAGIIHAHAQSSEVLLGGSICPVDPGAPAAGEVSPHGAYITRKTLRADETQASLTFEVALKMHNFAELQARVAQGARVRSPELAAKYEPTAAEYAQVIAWLSSQGFTVTRQEKSHLAVFARGTVAQIQTAMHASFARVSNGSTEFTSAITAPSVPGTLAPLLVGINGLQPHLHYHKHSIQLKNSLSGTNPPYLPSQIAQAYHITPLYNSNVTGAGQCIAIVIDTFPNTSDLTSYWSTCSINQSLNNLTFINVNSATLPSPSGEETLDTEWCSSIAYGAKVRVYAAGSLDFTAIDQAYAQVDDDVAANPSLNINQLSMSYGLGEIYEAQDTTQSGASQLQTDDQYFVELAAAGVGCFASTGDAGATPSSSGGAGNTLQPEMPACDPNVTGVGGTSLTLTSSGSESTEVVWNDSYGASGGGISEYFSQPSWQTGAGVPSGGGRCVPDVSGPADPANGGLIILNGSQYQYGGTSWSSPTWAAFCALINQSRANAAQAAVGELAPVLYAYNGTADFRDITSGNNKFHSRLGYTAATGYDECTGIGVPDVAALASALTPTGTAPAFTDGPPPATTTLNTAYTFTYTASGNPAPSFSVTSGSLPPGLSLSPAGAITGTTTLAGSYTGTVTADNGVSPAAQQSFAISVDQAPAFTSTPIAATISTGLSYSANFQATGYPSPTFTLTSGSLPPGLTLSSNGMISGAPTQAGAFTGIITASNGVGTAVTQAFTITVYQATDTPTLPHWGIAVLAGALVLTAARFTSTPPPFSAPRRFT